MNKTYQLQDALVRARISPSVWHAVPVDVLQAIGRDYLVKIGVERAGSSWGGWGERFWCRVVAVSEVGYKVQVAQDLERSARHGVRNEDVLWIGGQHIFAITRPDGKTIWQAWQQPTSSR